MEGPLAMIPAFRPAPMPHSLIFWAAGLMILGGIFFLLPSPSSAASITPALYSDDPYHVPDEIDLGAGIQDWYYRETAGDSDSAALLEGHIRAISYWGPVIIASDLSYMGSFYGRYNGSTIETGQPLQMPMAETVNQSSVHLGFLAINTAWDSLGMWASYGYHQQIWMTPAQDGGYQENYQIPYLGGTLYNQNPLPGTAWTFYEELGYRTALSPTMTSFPSAGQSIPAGTYNLGGSWNVHAMAGVRYMFNHLVGLYLNANYSYWAITQSTNTLSSGGVQYFEPSSITSYFGSEAGVTLEF
jgi:hypothetical protein